MPQVLKIILIVVLILGIAVAGLAAWYVKVYTKVPSLEISTDNSLEQNVAQLDEWFQELHDKNKFNGAVLIAKDHEPRFMKTYGYTSGDKRTKLTNQSSFRLASVSKQFTAAGVMLLEEKGLIDYDDLVSKHIIGFPYVGVTIRQLLNQTSGMPDVYMGLSTTESKRTGDTLTIAQTVDLIIKHPTSPKAAPNQEYNYCNTNYLLLAGLIEVVSGQTFEAYMQTELFDPMGLKNTRVWNLHSGVSTFENKTEGFDRLSGKPMLPSELDGISGDGGVFSSIEDFLIWDQFWYKNPLISSDNLKEAFVKPEHISLEIQRIKLALFFWIIA